MKQEGLKYFTDMSLPLIGFMIFLILFIVFAYRVYKMPNASIAALSNQPLVDEGDENVSRK